MRNEWQINTQFADRLPTKDKKQRITVYFFCLDFMKYLMEKANEFNESIVRMNVKNELLI